MQFILPPLVPSSVSVNLFKFSKTSLANTSQHRGLTCPPPHPGGCGEPEHIWHIWWVCVGLSSGLDLWSVWADPPPHLPGRAAGRHRKSGGQSEIPGIPASPLHPPTPPSLAPVACIQVSSGEMKKEPKTTESRKWRLKFHSFYATMYLNSNSMNLILETYMGVRYYRKGFQVEYSKFNSNCLSIICELHPPMEYTGS